MTDIDKVLAEEGVADAPSWTPTGNVAPDQLSRLDSGVTRQAATATQFTATSQPLDRTPLSSALRRRLRRESAEAVADRAIELAEAGSIRHMEYVRDTLEGKPGVRIADGEWNPDQSPQFAILQQFAARFVAEPQTTPELPSGSPQAETGLPEG